MWHVLFIHLQVFLSAAAGLTLLRLAIQALQSIRQRHRMARLLPARQIAAVQQAAHQNGNGFGTPARARFL
jgi:hypothetical protein